MSSMSTDPVERLQQGDTSAFREIVETHQARIRTVVACMGVPPSDVDDIAQDAFIHVYRNIEKFEAGTNFEVWIKTIARFKARAYFESRKRETKNKGNALEHFLLSKGEANAETMTDTEPDELVLRLRHCLSSLTDRARSVITRRYQGVPLQRLAEELSRSVAAIKMMLLRTRIQLRKCVEAET